MISYHEALQIIVNSVSALSQEQTPLSGLTGCAVAADVSSDAAVPPFANTAMDGYALDSAQTAGATPATPVEIGVAGIITAGESPPASTPAGQCWEIMTGAPMPPDCDAVIPVENVECTTDATGAPVSIRFDEPVQAGKHVRASGQDIATGQTILTTGRPLQPHAVMGLAAIGRSELAVRPAPRVAIITTGNELLNNEIPLQGGLIRDANGPYLAACMDRMNIRLTMHDSVSDEPAALQSAIENAAKNADVILTTGGVSAGRMDFVPSVITAMGGEILFHKVSMRPGKPLLFARLAPKKWIFGLPGNPIAVAVGLRFFVIPALRALQGLPDEQFHPAISLDPIRKRQGFRFFAKAVASVDEQGRMAVQILPGQESFKISPLIRSNCWAIIPEGKETVNPGELIKVAPLYPTEFLQPGS